MIFICWKSSIVWNLSSSYAFWHFVMIICCAISGLHLSSLFDSSWGISSLMLNSVIFWPYMKHYNFADFLPFNFILFCRTIHFILTMGTFDVDNKLCYSAEIMPLWILYLDCVTWIKETVQPEWKGNSVLELYNISVWFYFAT